MTDPINVRAWRPGDRAAVSEIYSAAFPDEDLAPLVAALSGREDVTSFVAETGKRIVGHIAFTRCGLCAVRRSSLADRSSGLEPPSKADRARSAQSGATDDGRDCALLGPLAVHPDAMRRGVGGGLTRAGIAEMRRKGMAAILVLGDPAYYCRFGFTPEAAIEPPYPLPDEWREAWRSIRLANDARRAPVALKVPDPWSDPALWR